MYLFLPGIQRGYRRLIKRLILHRRCYLFEEKSRQYPKRYPVGVIYMKFLFYFTDIPPPSAAVVGYCTPSGINPGILPI